MVAYRRWLYMYMRGSNCMALNWKILVFWVGGKGGVHLECMRGGRTHRFDCILTTLEGTYIDLRQGSH